MYKLLILAIIVVITSCVRFQPNHEAVPLRGSGDNLLRLNYTNCYYAILNRFQCPNYPLNPESLVRYTFFPRRNKLGATVQCARGTIRRLVDYQWTGRCEWSSMNQINKHFKISYQFYKSHSQSFFLILQYLQDRQYVF